MRFIDTGAAEPDATWVARASTLTQQLDEATTKGERDLIIQNNAGLWGELKPWLLGLSHQKCWFSEARDTYSHLEVEHYRPKIAAKNLDGSLRADGYWWLAFDWRNLRVCGNVGNRKKGAYFPLRDGTVVASATNRNTDDEAPYLLDPARAGDHALICFDENGDVNPTPGLDTWSTERAVESIKRYKLREHEALMEARRAVWSRCTLVVNRCQNLLDEESKAPSATKREEIRQQMLRIREMANPAAEFSAAANDCLRSRPEDWAKRLASAA